MSFNRADLDQASLTTLGITQNDLDGKSVGAIKALISRQYKIAALKYHPDRGVGSDSGKFRLVCEAYATLTDVFGRYTVDLAENAGIYIPLGTFNLVMEEEVERIYNELTLELSMEKDDSSRHAFEKKHKKFFSLAKCLQENRDEFQRHRISMLWQQVYKTPVLHTLVLDWRKLVIRLFGQEYLNDFQYREALRSGDLWPILDNTKLMLPTKWLAFIVNSVLLGLSLIHQIPNAPIFSSLSQSTKSMIGFALFFSLSILLPSPISLLIIGVYLIQDIVLALACPYNRLFMPLKTYLSARKNEEILKDIAIAGILTAGLLCAAVSAVFLPPSQFIILVGLALRVWNIRQMYAMSDANNKLTGTRDNFLSTVVTINTVLQCLAIAVETALFFYGIHLQIHHLPQPTAGLSWGDYCIDLLCNNFLLYDITKKLEHIDDIVAEMTEQLPLPEAAVSENIQKIYTSMPTHATQSHYFFNTPKNAQPKNAAPEEEFLGTQGAPLGLAAA
ncbi:MAG: J domain-containing protein [Legionella sp.]|nr:J domain-containing protein [Legionella sp.]